MTPKPDSRLPWRVVCDEPNAVWQVWTRFDDSLGSRNNYMIAGNIQNEDEAHVLASAPHLLLTLKICEDILANSKPIDYKRDCYTALQTIQFALDQSGKGSELIAQAPELQARVQSLTLAKDAALAILERLQTGLERPMQAIREAIEVLKRI